MEFYKYQSGKIGQNFKVSIPNGMEFYLYSFSIFFTVLKVSIPNGMEFYYAITDIATACGGFNSQRDGILLGKVCGKIHYEVQFQFPTGWNSTLAGFVLRAAKIVSIPNGMEFYASLQSEKALYNERFNSQRDGILQYP